MPDTSDKGKRVFIAGTTVSTPEHVFFAIYNTLYNVTEFVWEQPAADTIREISRAVEVDPNNHQVLLITDRYSNTPFETTCASLTTDYQMRQIAVRAFGLKSLSPLRYFR